jgi:hypothetical protein
MEKINRHQLAVLTYIGGCFWLFRLHIHNSLFNLPAYAIPGASRTSKARKRPNFGEQQTPLKREIHEHEARKA